MTKLASTHCYYIWVYYECTLLLNHLPIYMLELFKVRWILIGYHVFIVYQLETNSSGSDFNNIVPLCRYGYCYSYRPGYERAFTQNVKYVI